MTLRIPDNLTSRYLALLAGLTALYLLYGYASGVAFGHAIFELDLFFLITVLFTILVSLTERAWSATLLGTISGLLLFGDPSAPVGIGLSLIPNGIVFDLVTRRGSRLSDRGSRIQFAIAGALGNLAMAVTGLLIAFGSGALPTTGVSLAISVAVAIVGNPFVGVLGALVGIAVVERVGQRDRSPLIR